MTKLKELSDITAAKRKSLKKDMWLKSNISKSHYDKIMAGSRKPSFDTVKKLAKVFEMDVHELEQVVLEDYPDYEPKTLRDKDLSDSNDSTEPPHKAHETSKANNDITAPSTKEAPGSKDSSRLPHKWITAVSVLITSLALIYVFIVTPPWYEGPPELKIPYSERTETSEGDKTTFIKDVTIPDGTAIPVNTRYKKVWRVKNSGNTPWINRYLVRMTPQSEFMCKSPDRIRIPDTMPGQTVDLEVEFETPATPGSCHTDWKSAEADGELHFPDAIPLYSIVNVVKVE